MTIKKLRSASGMTQQAFADLLDIPKRTIENWENGQRSCPTYLVNLIEFYLTHKGYTKESEEQMERQVADQKMHQLAIGLEMQSLQRILHRYSTRFKPLSEFTEETEKSGGACGMYYDDSEPRYLPACYHDPDAGYPFVNDPYYIDSYEDEERERIAVYWEEENKHFEGLHIDFVPQEDIGGYFRLYSKFLPVESSREDADYYSEDLPDGDYCADVIVIHENTVLGIDRPFI